MGVLVVNSVHSDVVGAAAAVPAVCGPSTSPSLAGLAERLGRRQEGCLFGRVWHLLPVRRREHQLVERIAELKGRPRIRRGGERSDAAWQPLAGVREGVDDGVDGGVDEGVDGGGWSSTGVLPGASGSCASVESLECGREGTSRLHFRSRWPHLPPAWSDPAPAALERIAG